MSHREGTLVASNYTSTFVYVCRSGVCEPEAMRTPARRAPRGSPHVAGLLLVWLWSLSSFSVFRTCSLTAAAIAADFEASASLQHLVPDSKAAKALREKGIVYFDPARIPGINATNFFETLCKF